MKFKELSSKDKKCIALTTVFGVGYTPLMPGTAASAVGLLAFILIRSQIVFLLFTVFVVYLAYALSTRAEQIYAQKDCKKIVIDDLAGMLVSYLFIPYDIRYAIVGFFLFRMFDMFKVPPANKLEKFGGAKGIVGDDIVAGLYALIILQLARLTIHIFS